MNRIMALVWAAGGLFVGHLGLKIALAPKGDASGWVLAAVFLGIAGIFGWNAWKDWRRKAPSPPAQFPEPERADRQTVDFPPGTEPPDPIPLEDQITRLARAGLMLAPGRTVEELLHSWSREAYETDPYQLLLFMYGGEVEAEPWGRAFCERVWNFDMECLAETGDYARAFEPVARITGRPGLVTGLSDDFDPRADTVRVRYEIEGEPRTLTARVDNDWADPHAVMAFARDIETAVGDGRRYWAADNGQSSVLMFLTDLEATAVNALRSDLLELYVPA